MLSYGRMSVKHTVASVMSPHPMTIASSATLADAKEVFVSHRFTSLPVTGASGQLVGIVSVSDLLRAGDKPDDPVLEVMTTRLATARPEEAVAVAASTMVGAGVHHLVVIDTATRPIGVISNLDVARAVAELEDENPVHWIMSSEPLTVDCGADPDDARALLIDSGYSSAPVTAQGRVVGFVTQVTLLRGAAEGASRVDETMEVGVHTFDESATISQVADMMAETGSRRIFVTDSEGDLVGLVTVTDIAGYAASLLETDCA